MLDLNGFDLIKVYELPADAHPWIVERPEPASLGSPVEPRRFVVAEDDGARLLSIILGSGNVHLSGQRDRKDIDQSLFAAAQRGYVIAETGLRNRQRRQSIHCGGSEPVLRLVEFQTPVLEGITRRYFLPVEAAV